MEKVILTEKYEQIVGKEQAEKFEAFRALLIEYNAKYNLTAILEERDIFYKHFVDSLFISRIYLLCRAEIRSDFRLRLVRIFAQIP